MQKILGAFVIALLSSVAAAQARLTVSAPVANVGEEVTITYVNAARAGEVITVRIDEGKYPSGQVQEVQIQLDANGEGCVKWIVPNWAAASFNAVEAHEAILAIDE